MDIYDLVEGFSCLTNVRLFSAIAKGKGRIYLLFPQRVLESRVAAVLFAETIGLLSACRAVGLGLLLPAREELLKRVKAALEHEAKALRRQRLTHVLVHAVVVAVALEAECTSSIELVLEVKFADVLP